MESTSLPQRFIVHLFIPLISNWIGQSLFVRMSALGRRIKKYAATYRALEDIYTYSYSDTKGKEFFERLFTDILLHFVNAKGVRNRLIIIEQELLKLIFSLGKKKIHIMSLGSGSARAILGTIASNTDGVVCEATLIDKSRAALIYSQKMAIGLRLDTDNFVWERGLIEEFVKNGKKHPPDIVEMAGIMDYFEDETAVNVLKQIFRFLLPGGALITCNICDNPERIFLERVLNWHMIYRNVSQLSAIMQKAGFENFKIIQEPLGIHNIAIGYKPLDP